MPGVSVVSSMMVVMSAGAGSFEKFRRNLEITGLQEQVVAARHGAVRSALDRELTVRASLLTGSYRRHTLIGPIQQADIDIVVVLHRQYRGRGPRAVLDMVKRVLTKEYSSSKISRNGQAVTISFADFTVDVVPAFTTLWDEKVIDICNSGDDSWIRTSPARHIEISSKINDRTGGVLVPTVKMLKAWNRSAGRPLRSFHLEVLAWKIFDPGPLRTFFAGKGSGLGTDAENLSRFFSEAPARLRGTLLDPAREQGADLGAYLTDHARNEATLKLGTAADNCQRAGQLVLSGDISDANAIYWRVFGDVFPR